MRVGLDLLFLVPGRTGGRETHARELLRAIAARPDAPQIVAFLGADAASAGRGWWTDVPDEVVVLPRVTTRRTASWALGEMAGVARAAARAKVDVLHGPANFVPPAGPFARVLTLHDVAWRKLPDLMPTARRRATDALVVPGAKRAHRVITVSEASARDIETEFRIPRERIDVIPNGLTRPQTLNTPLRRGLTPLGGLVEGSGEKRASVLSVATYLPHKNLEMLVDVLALLPEPRPRLVIAGAGTDGGGLAARARERGVAEDVELRGEVSGEELEALYAAATVYVTATLYEGFGFPVLEAMARDVPVVCSDLPVLHEVAGDEALFVDPREPEAIAAAVARVLEDPRPMPGGRERAQRYTWDAAAEATLAVYRRAAASLNP